MGFLSPLVSENQIVSTQAPIMPLFSKPCSLPRELHPRFLPFSDKELSLHLFKTKENSESESSDSDSEKP
jgi:hypothetical protein